jgi:AcrR family transcriptional regulator
MSDDETRDRILAAAAALLAERGYVATTTRAIATAAGVNEVTLFRRFGSKQGLLRALVAAGAARQRDRDPQPSGDLAAALRTMARREIRDARENGGLAIRLAFDARSVPEIREALGDVLPVRMHRFASYLRAGQAAGYLRSDLPAELIAESFFALTSSFVMYRIATGDPSPTDEDDLDRLADQLLSIFWTGVADPALLGGDP